MTEQVVVEQIPTWQPGTFVRLKSGGPRMTVVRVNDDDTVLCVWMTDEYPSWTSFPKVVLVSG